MRALIVALFALFALVGAGVPAGAAAASAASEEYCNHTSGCIRVDSVSFSNRSFTLVGSLFDDRNEATTTAVFWFYAGGNFWTKQTRTARNERKGILVEETGPVGGIDYVRVFLVNNKTQYPTPVVDYVKL